jgi:hypothetical protein
MSRTKTAVTIGDGQAQGGEGQHDATLVAGGDKKTQAGHDDEQGPNAFMQPLANVSLITNSQGRSERIYSFMLEVLRNTLWHCVTVKSTTKNHILFYTPGGLKDTPTTLL